MHRFCIAPVEVHDTPAFGALRVREPSLVARHDDAGRQHAGRRGVPFRCYKGGEGLYGPPPQKRTLEPGDLRAPVHLVGDRVRADRGPAGIRRD